MLAPCHDFPGYSVDREGRVYSHWRRLRRGGFLTGFTAYADLSRRSELGQEPDQYGYLRVRLRRDGRRYWRRVNVLVCEAFTGPRPFEGAQCRHLDGDRRNNRAENLAWGTAMENTLDRFEHGTVLSGPAHPMAAFSSGDVVEIFDEYSAGMSVATIAALRGVSTSAVRDLLSGRTYKQFSRA